MFFFLCIIMFVCKSTFIGVEAYCNVPTPPDPFNALMLQLYNDVRATVAEPASNMQVLQFDPCLAKVASEYLKTCPGLQRNPDEEGDAQALGCEHHEFLGESMMAKSNYSTLTDLSLATSAVKYFTSDFEEYDQADDRCGSHSCSNYRKMIHAQSTHLGCAKAFDCTEQDSTKMFVVCYTSPRGAPQDYESSYLAGTPCSDASCSGSCDSGLCCGAGGQATQEPATEETTEQPTTQQPATTTQPGANTGFCGLPIPDGDFHAEMLRLHNEARTRVLEDMGYPASNMQALEYDFCLVAVAQKHFETCSGYGHTRSSEREAYARELGCEDAAYMGENIWGGYNYTKETGYGSKGGGKTQIDVANSAFGAWYTKERLWYDLKDDDCSAPSGYYCGHYEGIISAQRTRLGCAYAQNCDSSNPDKLLVTCHMTPFGKHTGEKDWAGKYAIGEPCSHWSCTGGCDRGLCCRN